MYTFHDGSILRVLSAKELIQIPIWKGNRTLDKAHAERIRDAVGDIVHSLDSGYRIIHYDEPDTSGRIVRQSYLIDGQHRAHVLREHFLSMCEPDFPVVVTEKTVESESDAIEYFNAINNVKPQRWRTDPAILANQYIAALEQTFNTSKLKLIRQTTVRPYLSVEKLREVIKANIDKLAQEPAAIQAFCLKAVEKNKALLQQVDMLILGKPREAKYYERAAECGFLLAVDPKLPWIAELAP